MKQMMSMKMENLRPIIKKLNLIQIILYCQIVTKYLVMKSELFTIFVSKHSAPVLLRSLMLQGSHLFDFRAVQ
jgi:hypothetical protein